MTVTIDDLIEEILSHVSYEEDPRVNQRLKQAADLIGRGGATAATRTYEYLSHCTVELMEVNASDASVVSAARVSTLGSQITWATDEAEGLIKFLARNRHGTPFEHNHFVFYVHAPIFVFREYHRHRIGWSYNEESGRYKQLDPVFYLPPPERPLVQVGKVGDYQFLPGTDKTYELLIDSMVMDCELLYRSYEYRLNELEIAKEVARMTLPVNIFSSMYATCNARSLMAFLSLRTQHEDAAYPSKPMYEIRTVADKLEEFFLTAMPITANAFIDGGRVAP